jgi:hypothetical protein
MSALLQKDQNDDAKFVFPPQYRFVSGSSCRPEDYSCAATTGD